MKRIYLDYAATTPVDARVLEEMQKYYLYKDGLFGNASSLHAFGQSAHAALEGARTRIARELGVHHSEIIFFSSATEANNFALRSVAKKYRQTTKKTPHIIISGLEHPSVSQTAESMRDAGEIELDVIPSDKNGFVQKEKISLLLRKNTALISVIYVQNEIGTVQNISEISAVVAEYKDTEGGLYPLLHTDASQGYLCNLEPKKLGADLMTLSGHKMYCPKGAAALYVGGDRIDRKDILVPITTGGGHEKDLRSGTENIPALVGFARAIELVGEGRTRESVRLKNLSDRFVRQIKSEISNVCIQGGDPRSPHILRMHIPGVENMAVSFDMQGIAASAGSACAQRAPKKSTILESVGYSEKEILQSIRFSFGRYTTEKEIDEAAKKIIMVIQNSKR